MLKVLLAFLAAWLSLANAGHVDYAKCNWVRKMQGQTVQCPSGSVGVGACGSGKNANCNSFFEGLKCCELVGGAADQTEKNVTAGDPRYCIVYEGTFGEHLTCSGDHPCVYSTCGSGEQPDCGYGSKIHVKIGCCITPELDVTLSCRWLYGTYGQELECSTAGEVMTGKCGSGKNGDCPNGTYHGIQCCQYN